MDADGSQADLGCFTFVPPPPVLGGVEYPVGGFNFTLAAYPNRNYVLERSSDGVDWSFWQRVFQGNATMPLHDPDSATTMRLYRARLAP